MDQNRNALCSILSSFKFSWLLVNHNSSENDKREDEKDKNKIKNKYEKIQNFFVNWFALR